MRLNTFLVMTMILAASLCPAGQLRKEPAEDVFQKGAQLYQSGRRAEALKLFIAAAQAGNRKSAVQVGYCYESGNGAPVNYAEAAKWYRKGAEMGDSRGQKNLGQMYERGRGVPEDWVEAAKWYQKSAAQGDRDGEAALATAYQFGIGVPQSRKDAIFWAKRAGDHGDEESAYWARWLRDPTNNIGFRNAAERNVVIGYRMVDMVVHNEPAGVVFRNSRERNAYLTRVAQRLDNDMSYARWWRARAEYTRCESERRGGCRNPGPEPR